MANERISVDKANHVATLTLNRPEKHNAFDGVALQEFGQCMDELSKDEDTRVIIITGAGKSFCADSDTAYISEIQAIWVKRRSDSISINPLVRIRYSPRLSTTVRSPRLRPSTVLL